MRELHNSLQTLPQPNRKPLLFSETMTKEMIHSENFKLTQHAVTAACKCLANHSEFNDIPYKQKDEDRFKFKGRFLNPMS